VRPLNRLALPDPNVLLSAAAAALPANTCIWLTGLFGKFVSECFQGIVCANKEDAFKIWL
jgi:hypothetical protein